MADIEDDDSLDDLLRDSSVNKFPKPKFTSSNENQETNTLEASSTRKEKKSALMAELFGSSSTSILDIITPEVPLPSTIKDAPSKFAIPSTKEDMSDKNNIGSYIPTFGGNKSSSKSITSSPVMKTKDFTDISDGRNTNTFIAAQTFSSRPPLQTNTTIDSLPTIVHQTTSHGTAENPAFVSHRTTANVSENIDGNKISLDSNMDKPVTVQLLPLRDMFENFTKSLCKQLEGLSTKSNASEDLLHAVVEVTNSLNKMREAHVTYSEKQLSLANEFYEQRIAAMESQVQQLTKDNLTLHAQLKHFETQMANHMTEHSQMKSDAEMTLQNKLGSLFEKVTQLERNSRDHIDRVDQRNSLAEKQIEIKLQEIGSSLETRINNTLREARIRKDEILSDLFQQELKWLQEEKMKLELERRTNENLRLEIRKRLKHYDRFMKELQEMAAKLEQQSELNSENNLKLQQKWLKIYQQEEQLKQVKEEFLKQPNNPRNKSLLENLAFSLWNLQTKRDEQLLLEQEKFLHSLNKNVV